MSDFYIKRGDRLPSLAATLLGADSAVINLTGATVEFHLLAVGGISLVVSAAAVIVSATLGTVRYDWGASDTTTPGDYYGEFQITFSDGKKLSVPNDSHFRVTITDDLD